MDKLDLQNELSGAPERVAQCFETLQQDSGQDSQKRITLIRRIRGVMREYHEALLLQGEVLKLPTPSKRVMEVLSGPRSMWMLERPLVGSDWDLFDDHKDLAALKPATGEDRLSVFLQDRCGHLFKKEQSGNVGYFPESYITGITNVVTILAAAMLLVGAIVSLYAVKSDGKRLGLLAAFTSLFALCVGILTNARRAEIFAATAGYAAVLVVFISSNIH